MNRENRMISFNGQDICTPEETLLSILPRWDTGAVTNYGIVIEEYQQEADVYYICDFWPKHQDACITMDEDTSATLIEKFIYDMNLPNEGVCYGEENFEHYGENVYDIKYFERFLRRFDELSVIIEEEPLSFLQYYKQNSEYGPKIHDIIYSMSPVKTSKLWYQLTGFLNTPELEEKFVLLNLWAVNNFYKKFGNMMREKHKRWPNADKFAILGP